MFISLECPAGLYGEHCSNNCGNCLNNTNCHHVNGTCSEGCEPGYQEHNCTEGKYLYRVNLKKKLLLKEICFKVFKTPCSNTNEMFNLGKLSLNICQTIESSIRWILSTFGFEQSLSYHI